MKEAIRRIILDLFPELSGKHHLPRWGQVVGVRETPTAGDIADEFRPFFAVDIQVLDEYGQPDTEYPVLHDVPLPFPSGGHESGAFSYPGNGTWCEIAFAYGSPNKPFIRCILPYNLSLPAIALGEQKQQFSNSVYQRIAADGSHERVTDQMIKDDSFKRQVNAVESAEQFTKSTRTIEADDIHVIGGIKKVTADGGISLLGGERVAVGSTGDVTVNAATEQSHIAPKTWIGSEGENALKLLSELHAQVKSLTDVLASHTHPTVGAITQGAQVTAVGSAVTAIKSRLDGITKA